MRGGWSPLHWSGARSGGWRLLAIGGALVVVAACVAAPVVALASAVESCHDIPLAQGRCDGSSAHFGHIAVAVPAGAVQIPGLPAAGRLGSSQRLRLPGIPFPSSIAARAPPLS